MSLVWSDPESRERRKPEAELPLFAGEITDAYTPMADSGTNVKSLSAEKSAPGSIFEQAHARKADPQTSKDAAKGVRNITATQSAILHVFSTYGVLIDEQLIEKYREFQVGMGYPAASDAGIRSRRAQLVQKGLIVPSAVGKNKAGRSCWKWMLA